MSSTIIIIIISLALVAVEAAAAAAVWRSRIIFSVWVRIGGPLPPPPPAVGVAAQITGMGHGEDYYD